MYLYLCSPSINWMQSHISENYFWMKIYLSINAHVDFLHRVLIFQANNPLSEASCPTQDCHGSVFISGNKYQSRGHTLHM